VGNPILLRRFHFTIVWSFLEFACTFSSWIDHGDGRGFGLQKGRVETLHLLRQGEAYIQVYKAQTWLAILKQSPSVNIHPTSECEARSSACNAKQVTPFKSKLSNQEGCYYSLHLNQATNKETRSILCSSLLRLTHKVSGPILRLSGLVGKPYALIPYCNTPKISFG
jgi:hypothetical protein